MGLTHEHRSRLYRHEGTLGRVFREREIFPRNSGRGTNRSRALEPAQLKPWELEYPDQWLCDKCHTYWGCSHNPGAKIPTRCSKCGEPKMCIRCKHYQPKPRVKERPMWMARANRTTQEKFGPDGTYVPPYMDQEIPWPGDNERVF